MVWVLTREIDDDNQDGEYFQAVFNLKPTKQQLLYMGIPSNRLDHVLEGGGRIWIEYEWYYLREHLKLDDEESRLLYDLIYSQEEV